MGNDELLKSVKVRIKRSNWGAGATAYVSIWEYNSASDFTLTSNGFLVNKSALGYGAQGSTVTPSGTLLNPALETVADFSDQELLLDTNKYYAIGIGAGTAPPGGWPNPPHPDVKMAGYSSVLEDCFMSWGSTFACSDFSESGTFDGLWYEVATSYKPINQNITATTTWEGGGKVYQVSGDISIAPGVTLTIEPGAIIKFDTSTSSSLTVEGTLNAEGTPNASGDLNEIFFTSFEDDLIGGDTNANASSTAPSASDWGGIFISSGGSATFEHSILRYGGGGSAAALIHNNGGSLILSTSTVVYSPTYSIKNSAGTVAITASDIGFSDYGLYVDNGSASITASSTIHDNELYGVYNNTGTSINAEGNWWATSTGPYHASLNPGGEGNAVSDNVDFAPWVSTTHYVQGNCPSSTCGSVRAGDLVWESASGYSTEISDAITTWNALGATIVVATSTYKTLSISDVNRSDVAWKGSWVPLGPPDIIELNTYHLSQNTLNERKNTIIHELGHALGFGHSFTGNVMNSYQSSQTSLGPQDISDYLYLWP